MYLAGAHRGELSRCLLSHLASDRAAAPASLSALEVAQGTCILRVWSLVPEGW